MKKIVTLSLLLISVFSNQYARSQYCGTPTATVGITPNSTTQYTSAYSSGFIVFTYSATAGCTYSFTTCGLSSADTYLRLYSTPSQTLLVAADDQCGLQSSISWVCPTTGTYSILLSNYPCNPLNVSTQIA